ncbi:MAG: RNA 2',3'-cyclic phosphodiesterase [Candidatus Magasanikbacteria bacterium]
MRLFISLPLNEEAKEKISKSLKSVRAKLRGQKIRYEPPKKWHFTLVFLGNQPKQSLKKIKSGLEKATQNIEPVKVHMNQIMWAPPNSKPRMIWATTSKDTSNQMGAIKGKVREVLESQGLKWDKDNRSYKGHITLARFDPAKVSNLPQISKELEVSFKPQSVHLMESQLSKQGSQYKKIDGFSI